MNSPQTLAIFDLDNTLLGGDSDHAWGEFLINKNLVDAKQHRETNDGFYQAYCDGTLDINAYLVFVLATLSGKSADELNDLHNDFMAEMIAPMWLHKAEAVLQQHRDNGDSLLIITATNDFITRPIANKLGVDDILASNAEIKNGVYTGKPTGVPCFKEGKVTRLQQWLEQQRINGLAFDLSNAWFYSDSHNDIPLLEAVGKPVAVDADATLTAHANAAGWQSMSFRGE